jgi:hypothetical protein
VTDRIPLDDMTSDQLDHLYNDLAWAEAEAASADASASSHADRANTAEATLARVHAYAVHAIDAGDTGPGPTLGRTLLQLLDGDTAATQATEPPAQDGGPDVTEAAHDDRTWDLRKTGE